MKIRYKLLYSWYLSLDRRSSGCSWRWEGTQPFWTLSLCHNSNFRPGRQNCCSNTVSFSADC